MRTSTSLALISATILSALISACADSSNNFESGIQLNPIGIVGADPFDPRAPGYSSTVTIYYSGEQSCTGTLIDKKLVLTAAHCVVNRHLANMKLVFPISPKNTFGVANVRAHYDYLHLTKTDNNIGRALSRNDIAIIKVDNFAPREAQIAQLPDAPLAVGEQITLKAFGSGRPSARAYRAADNMQSVEVVGFVEAESEEKITIDQSIEKGVCKGDSGGPFFIFKDDTPIVVGITSSADRWKLENGRVIGELCHYNSLATQVGSHLRWLTKVIQEFQ